MQVQDRNPLGRERAAGQRPGSFSREIDEREVLTCSHCRLVQFRTQNSLCRRCLRPPCTEIAEPPASAAVSVPVPPSPMVVRKEVDIVGTRVRDLRVKQGLTQSELAERIQVPRTYISKVERHRAVPTLVSLGRIASGLDVEMIELVDRRTAVLASILRDPFMREIAEMAGKLDGSRKTLLIRSVREASQGKALSEAIEEQAKDEAFLTRTGLGV